MTGANAKLVTVLRVNFIGLCEEIAEKLDIKDYHDVWDAFANGEGFPNDSDQVLSRDIVSYWGSNDELMTRILSTLNEMYPGDEEIIARVCW
jgi:hypothetical protein